ncbi:hypothetical protein M427DRAFT_150240 [Gonapodya prolifera JEL478]|uniref:Uncharacterized protein n=1 Tax=Gonapodya prolifera (strain JEL478) TaxID=1344416 RepID=A0A138ZX35_GONPJ|nr:hypothetical protein M427DRAFT_150240 [Gonapodya prolifera JEL478]|eukprot:KXS09066.1 hypothetical protein M427DRAFT_150240 [Gonapodya prolifera JEL478]
MPKEMFSHCHCYMEQGGDRSHWTLSGASTPTQRLNTVQTAHAAIDGRWLAGSGVCYGNAATAETSALAGCTLRTRSPLSLSPPPPRLRPISFNRTLLHHPALLSLSHLPPLPLPPHHPYRHRLLLRPPLPLGPRTLPHAKTPHLIPRISQTESIMRQKEPEERRAGVGALLRDTHMDEPLSSSSGGGGGGSAGGGGASIADDGDEDESKFETAVDHLRRTHTVGRSRPFGLGRRDTTASPPLGLGRDRLLPGSRPKPNGNGHGGGCGRTSASTSASHTHTPPYGATRYRLARAQVSDPLATRAETSGLFESVDVVKAVVV